MTQKTKKSSPKALFKRALTTYTPGMSCRQLATALQVSEFSARQLLYKVRYLTISES